MRFNQPAYPTVHFSDKIWVQCPNCSNAALVTTTLSGNYRPSPSGLLSTCTCNSCGYTEKGSDKWSGYVQEYINKKCGSCGSDGILFSNKPTKEPKKTVKIRCVNCKKEKEYEVMWYRYQVGKPNDPYFGYDLWLQTDIKGNLLWLYNLKHLEYLKSYVEASIREDDGRHKYSMITNLPQWVKSAKNRDTIVKKLNKLAGKLKKL